MRKLIIMLAVVVIAVCAVVCAFVYAQNNGYDNPFDVFKSTAAAESVYAPEAEHFALPAGWSTWQINVRNNLNDFEFDIVGCYQFNRSKAQFDFRVYKSELEYYIHYLQVEGYTFEGFNGWQLAREQLYYERGFASINAVELVCTHSPITYEIVFKDGITGAIIQSLTASYGSAVKAPSATDYADRGLIFTGWDGGDYDVVTRNTTLYSTYAPARYITVIMPDKSTQLIAVADGTPLSDVTAPDTGKAFKHWTDKDGDKLSADTVINYDVTLHAIYKGGGIPSWLTTTLIILGVLVGVALIIFITVKIFKRHNAA